MMKQIGCRVPDELLEAIERARGDVPRERWIRRALEAALSGSDYIHVSHRHEPIETVPREPDIQTGLVSPRPSGHLPTCKCAVCKPPKGVR